MSDPSRPTRKDIESFSPNLRTTRAIEGLFDATTGPTSVQTSAEEALISAASADARSAQSQGMIDVLSNAAMRKDLEPPEFDSYVKNIDYLDFNVNAPFATNQVGRVGWNNGRNTLDIVHNDGVVQQVGLESFVRVLNSTGSTLTKGTVVSFSTVASGEISVVPYNATGGIPGPFVLGLMASDVANGSVGKATVYGRIEDIDTTGTPVGEVWAAGDILYSNPATPGKMTKVRPTIPNMVVNVGIVVTVNATTGIILARLITTPRLDYGVFSDSTDQTQAAINTAKAITFDTTIASLGISRGVPTSRIVVARSGLFNIQWAAQLTSSNASTKDVYFWIRKNGTDVANTTGIISISNTSFTTVPSWSYTIPFVAGDYFEIMWATTDVNVVLDARVAPGFAPAIPSMLLSVFQVQL